MKFWEITLCGFRKLGNIVAEILFFCQCLVMFPIMGKLGNIFARNIFKILLVSARVLYTPKNAQVEKVC